jgi:flagellar motor protein MotB
MRPRDEESYNFWPVYSDLALSALLILILFLLGQAVVNSRLLVTQDIARARVQGLQETVRRSLHDVPGVDSVYVDGNTQIITLSADSLFPTDESGLTPKGRDLLLLISRLLRANNDRFTRVAVEGHADVRRSRRFYRTGDVPEDHGNWRLSAERSIEVVQLFQREGFAGEKLEAIGRSLYAPTDVAYRGFPDGEGADTVAALQASLRKNRRIVIRLFYSESESGPRK